MDKAYFTAKIWPHMFYMSDADLWRWKANVARVMGNSGMRRMSPISCGPFGENGDERTSAMIAWALGRIGGSGGETGPGGVSSRQRLSGPGGDPRSPGGRPGG